MYRLYHTLVALAISTLLVSPPYPLVRAEETNQETGETATEPSESSQQEKLPEGHSAHGEVFNEGPRQRALLLEGMGNVKFPATTKCEEAQAFINQGVAQLHGFWYFESERSFRQAAAHDPDCAIAYWGMAMSNMGNEKRAQGFIAEAMSRKEGATDRERKYIEALHAYLEAGRSKKQERAEAYTSALEKILYEYPDDVEAKALLALQLWQNRSAGLKIQSYLAADALMQQIFDVNPLHPAHHFCIHLWDYERPEKALASSAACGPSLPGIAHMWHMPGHIYSRLKRYPDAVWQQEASARVDHAHMMRYGVLPDQIHNFAHNNEWLIRNLIYLGRIGDALDLAQNMIELPRHPKYNVLTKSGCSSSFGRTRLFEVLATFELWDELIGLANSHYLEPTEIDREQVKRLRHLGQAYLRSGRVEQGEQILTDLRSRLLELQSQRDVAVTEALDKFDQKADVAAADSAETETVKTETAELETETETEEEVLTEAGAENAVAAVDVQASAENANGSTDGGQPEGDDSGDGAASSEDDQELDKEQTKEPEKVAETARKPYQDKIKGIEQAIAELEGHLAAIRGDYAAALESLKKAGGGVDAILKARYRLLAGEVDEALQDAEKHVKARQNETQPLAGYIELLWEAERREEAAKQFEQLREISGSIDLSARSPVFDRLGPIAEQLGLPTDWRQPHEVMTDIGDRPELDSLGPFRWGPSDAPAWTLTDAHGQPVSLKKYRGRPIVVIFYLGYGCLHCAEQLHHFAPMTQQFEEAGISLVAVSSDGPDGLRISLENFNEGEFPFPLVSDPELAVFRDYRVYDDFEQTPLHGTFLIDGDGRVRWHDLSYEPFMDGKFVLEEAQRLLHFEQP
jgi:peroxiredoxin